MNLEGFYSRKLFKTKDLTLTEIGQLVDLIIKKKIDLLQVLSCALHHYSKAVKAGYFREE
jgi:hypothetical protein